MGMRSAISGLPDEVRQELERRVVASGYSGRYEEHAAWLRGLGFAISHHMVRRYEEHMRREVAERRLRRDAVEASLRHADARARTLAKMCDAAQATARREAAERLALVALELGLDEPARAALRDAVMGR